MNLAERIARIEAALAPTKKASVPVIRLATDDGDPSQPYCVEFGHQSWTQAPGESLQQLLDRAQDVVVRSFVPAGRFPVLMLVARRQQPSIAPTGQP